MTLATHAVIGAAVVVSLPGWPLSGFMAAIASHFLLDALPHWDYQLRSRREDEQEPLNDDLILGRDFLVDLLKIFFDISLGVLLAALLFYRLDGSIGGWLITLGIIGGILPDLLQFVYFKFRREPLTSLQRFHHFIHTKYKLKGQPLRGVLTQATLVMLIWFVL